MKPAPAPRPPSPSRRAFVQGGAVSALTAARYARVPSANDRDGVGFIGSGLIGERHVLDFRAEPDVAAVAVAEVHRGRPDEATAPIGGTAKGTGNFLRWLDDRDVDAVAVSMLDHWHALMTMMACVAGQDVDVGERPSRGDRRSPGQPVATARPRASLGSGARDGPRRSGNRGDARTSRSCTLGWDPQGTGSGLN